MKVETQQRRWWVKNFMRKLLPTCGDCKKGKVRYSGEDWTGTHWKSIYECDHCHKEFV